MDEPVEIDEVAYDTPTGPNSDMPTTDLIETLAAAMRKLAAPGAPLINLTIRHLTIVLPPPPAAPPAPVLDAEP